MAKLSPCLTITSLTILNFNKKSGKIKTLTKISLTKEKETQSLTKVKILRGSADEKEYNVEKYRSTDL